MKHTINEHDTIMFFIMILSSLLSTMNIWVDKIEDMRLSMNDVYMILLMTAWMFLFMSIVYKDVTLFLVSGMSVLFIVWCIRTQFLVSESQYKMGMIPHHSMAVHMSRQLLQKDNRISDFANQIIKTQEDEINFLKQA